MDTMRTGDHMSNLSWSNIKHVFANISDYIWLKSVVAYLLIAAHWIFDRDFEFIWVIFLLIAFDTITGLMVAYKEGRISSQGFRQSFCKLFVYLIMLATGSLVDKTLPVAVTLELIVIFLSTTEAISILENIGQLGFPVPQKVLRKLEVFKDK